MPLDLDKKKLMMILQKQDQSMPFKITHDLGQVKMY